METRGNPEQTGRNQRDVDVGRAVPLYFFPPRREITPQIFAFLAVFLVIPFVSGDVVFPLLIRAIVSLLGLFLFARSLVGRGNEFSPEFVRQQVFLLATFLIVFQGIFPAPLLIGSAIFFSALFVSSFRLPSSFRVRIEVLFLAFGCLVTVELLTPGEKPFQDIEGFLLVAIAWLVFLFTSSPAKEEIAFPKPITLNTSSSPQSFQRASFGQEGVEEISVLDKILERVYRKEILSELASRLLLLALFTSITVFALGSVQTEQKLHFGVSWLALAVLFGLLYLQMIREKRSARAHWYATFAVIVLLAWWALLAFHALLSPFLLVVLLGLFLFTLGQIPLSPKVILVPAACAALLGGMICFLVVEERAACMVFIGLSLVAYLRSSCVSYYSSSSRAAWLTISRLADSLSAWGALWLLAEVARRIAAARYSLLLLDGGEGFRFQGTDVQALGREEADMKTLHAFVVELSKDGGMLHRGIFPAPLKEIFRGLTRGGLPRAFFLKFDLVLQEQERTAVLIAPLGISSFLAGKDRGFRSVFSIGAVVRLYFSGVRKRFHSEDVFFAAQRSATEREAEFNQVVHRVNNIAQDISIYVDRLSEVASLGSSELVPGQIIAEQIEELRRALAALSSSASDVKLLRELKTIRPTPFRDKVPPRDVLETVELYGQYLAQRTRIDFETVADLKASDAVSVVNREFLEASLRLLLRFSFEKTPVGGKVVLSVREHGSLFAIRVDDTSVAVDDEHRIQLIAITRHNPAAKPPLFELARLAELSDGAFHIRTSTLLSGTCYSLELQRDKDSPSQPDSLTEARRAWALFVDDSPEVTTFYARIAGALELPCETCSSLAEARELLNRLGAPSLIVTDIELGDGSGLELVSEVRKEHGAKIPIVVVSGNADEATSRRVIEVGANQFLSKPVRRKELFAVVQRFVPRRGGAGI